jgi:putative glutamine transport system substrate-binding protein
MYLEKLSVVVFVVGTLFTLETKAQLTGSSYAEAQKNKTAVWAFTYTESPSYASKQIDGSVQGLVVDIMKKFADYVTQTEHIKVTYEFKGSDPENFKKFLEEVKTGKGGVFGLGNVSITETRKKECEFSPSFIKNISLLCTHKDVPTLESLDNAATAFANFKGVVVAGSTDEKTMLELKTKYIPSAQIQRVENNQEAVNTIVKEKKAFTNLDFTFFFNAQKQGVPIKRHPVGDQSTEDFGVIMPKGNDWAPLLAKFLNSGFLKSAEYKKILFTHIGANGVQRLESFGKK